MEQLIAGLAALGPTGIIAGILVYDVFFLQKKLIQVIESNTKAMADLREYCRYKNEGGK